MDPNSNDKKMKKTRVKKTTPVDSTPVVEPKEKKPVKRVKKVKETVKIIQELNDKDNHSEDNDTEDKKEEESVVDNKESNIVIEKSLDISASGEEKEVYGYLIIQEFPHINTTYVIGSKPFGKIWFDYTEVLEQFIAVLIDWQVDFDNKEIIHSKKPRIVKVRVF
jgi:hypothetical protein